MREIIAIADEAEQNRLPFLIIGGLAVSSYGHVRSTAERILPFRAVIWTRGRVCSPSWAMP
jgi:hypothetical protein